MILFFYNIFLMLLVIMLSPLLVVVTFGSKKYRNILKKRLFMHFNSSNIPNEGTRIWIHAMSVGEVFSAESLVKKIMNNSSGVSIIFTVSTHAGYVVAEQCIKPYVNCVNYFPYDIPCLLIKVINNVKPDKVIFIETDFWPNFLFLLKKQKIPIYLINARISDRFYKNFTSLGKVTTSLFPFFDAICVQSFLDKELFLSLGVSEKKLFISGNIKFDFIQKLVPYKDLQQFRLNLGLSSNRPVWIAGSTHKGEEILISSALRSLFNKGIKPVLIIAPRDHERSDEICDIFKSINSTLVVHKFSKLIAINKGKINQVSDVIVLDRVGILRSLYVLSDVTFVGGSMVKEGGHNMLEPAFAGNPILFGPYTNDFKYIAAELEKCGGGICVNNLENLVSELTLLLSDPKQASEIGSNAHFFLESQKGAIDKTLNFLDLIF